MDKTFDYEETLPDGRRYTETRADILDKLHGFLAYVWREDRRPKRLCQLWSAGGEQELCYLVRFDVPQRFGEVVLPVEGLAGVATPPPHRRRGYASVLVRKVLERAAGRVLAMFLHGIEDYYDRFGFATCIGGPGRIEIRVLDTERVKPTEDVITAREMTREDLGAVCELFNREHARRPGTTERDPAVFDGPRSDEDWTTGQRAIVLEENGRVVGYSIQGGRGPGQGPSLTIVEAVARDPRIARELIRVSGARAHEQRFDKVTIYEPLDSTLGRAARRLGCETSMQSFAAGDWMGKILNRPDFVEALRPELDRRVGDSAPDALAALACGEICPDDAMLLPLITGYHSWRDAEDQGYALPPKYAEILRRWFPGGGTVELPTSWCSRLDWY